MKLNGKKIEGVNTEMIFIPRGEDTIVLTAQAIDDYTEHDGLNPIPRPIKGRNRKGELVEQRDSNFDKALDAYANRRVAYTIIKSLMLGTEEFEWETVNINDPNTWEKWQEELKTSGFTYAEILRIQNGVFIACGLNEEKVEAARKSFLAGRQAALAELSSPRDEQNFTVSGELVSE